MCTRTTNNVGIKCADYLRKCALTGGPRLRLHLSITDSRSRLKAGPEHFATSLNNRNYILTMLSCPDALVGVTSKLYQG
jgi:hypothetical protein